MNNLACDLELMFALIDHLKPAGNDMPIQYTHTTGSLVVTAEDKTMQAR